MGVVDEYIIVYSTMTKCWVARSLTIGLSGMGDTPNEALGNCTRTVDRFIERTRDQECCEFFKPTSRLIRDLAKSADALDGMDCDTSTAYRFDRVLEQVLAP